MADWEKVGRIKGDKGDTGEKGEQGERGATGATGSKGDKGDKGDTGAPMVIEGSLNSESELPPTGQLGNAYIVDGDLYVWK